MNEVEIKQISELDQPIYDLLLLADPSKEQVDNYVNKSLIYAAYINNNLIGVYVLFPVDDKVIEIKNIAINEKLQKQGFGSALLKNAIARAKHQGYEQIIIGTANSSIYQIYLYQKLGFDIYAIKQNFFLINYSHPIIENNIQAKHMIMFSLIL